jgi:hypothetical protein
MVQAWLRISGWLLDKFNPAAGGQHEKAADRSLSMFHTGRHIKLITQTSPLTVLVNAAPVSLAWKLFLLSNGVGYGAQG